MRPETLTWIRSIAYAIAGLTCAGYASAALAGVGPLPHWLPITSGIAAAIVFFISAAFAGPQNTAASLDESYQKDRRTAGVIGFWAAMITGTALWLLDIGGELQLAITMNTAAAMFLLTHVVLEFRGYR
jgi:hypothetical protein